MPPVDEITLNFSPEGLFVLNVILGLIMFGVALDLSVSDFQRLLQLPKSAVIGLTCQFFLLPAVTYVMVVFVQPQPSIALGLFLVAACPGGNISNFFTHLAGGNTALSISLSAISTSAAVVMTPLNFTFWSSMYPPASAILRTVSISPLDLFGTILLLLGIPLIFGMYVAHRFPDWAKRMHGPMKTASIGFFALFVALAFYVNFDYFLEYIGLVVFVVAVHNGLALFTGYAGSKVANLPEADRRAVSIEVAIQNSGLGLVLIFNFFDGLGGMAIIAAWWGIWHIIVGLTLSLIWSRNPDPVPAASS